VGTIFSVLDQSVANFALEAGQVAAAVNPLTDIGVSVNATTNQASIVDLRTPLRLTTVPVGAGPVAVAMLVDVEGMGAGRKLRDFEHDDDALGALGESRGADLLAFLESLTGDMPPNVGPPGRGDQARAAP